MIIDCCWAGDIADFIIAELLIVGLKNVVIIAATSALSLTTDQQDPHDPRAATAGWRDRDSATNWVGSFLSFALLLSIPDYSMKSMKKFKEFPDTIVAMLTTPSVFVPPELDNKRLGKLLHLGKCKAQALFSQRELGAAMRHRELDEVAGATTGPLKVGAEDARVREIVAKVFLRAGRDNTNIRFTVFSIAPTLEERHLSRFFCETFEFPARLMGAGTWIVELSRLTGDIEGVKAAIAAVKAD